MRLRRTALSYGGNTVLLALSVHVPLRKTSFDVGNYAYVQMTKQFSRARVAAGLYHFTSGAVAAAAKVGAQASVEQSLSKRVSLAGDWYSGNQSLGYFTTGTVIKLSSHFTLYPAYQIGNHGVTRGNHQFLFELGWNLN